MTPRLALVALAAAVVLPALPARAGGRAPEEQLAALAPSVVPVHVVAHAAISYQGQMVMDQEVKQSGLATVVDPSGLLLVGDIGHMTKALEQGMPGVSLSIAFRKIDVTLPGETADRPCALVARDSTLGLAFLQVMDLGDKTLPAVDLGKGGDPRLGEPLLGVRRHGRGFDHAPELLRLTTVQAVERPRRMWGVSGEFDEHGLLAFHEDGLPAGVLAMQFGAEGIDLASVAQGRSAGGDARVFLLPLEPVRGALARARDKVPEAVKKAKEAGAEAPPAAPAAMEGDAPPPK